MAIEGFDYQTFAQELSAQAGELIPEGLQPFQKEYVINTIKNFSTLCGEAIYNDEKTKFNADQAMLITQIIAEWTFHKSVDIIKSGVLPDYWDGVMQKLAFTIFEIAKQSILQGVEQDEVLKIVEHHVKKTYQKVIDELKERKVIDDEIYEKALKQSNIDDMMQQLQAEKETLEREESIKHAGDKSNSKVLKLASVALLLKQISQDKVQSILNKFNPNDAQAVIQYMQMPDLENKIDQNITVKCLQEIRTNLPEPKYINPNKILANISKLYTNHPKAKIEGVISKERPLVKEFIKKAHEGEFIHIPTKVANIITQHIEESIS